MALVDECRRFKSLSIYETWYSNSSTIQPVPHEITDRSIIKITECCEDLRILDIRSLSLLTDW